MKITLIVSVNESAPLVIHVHVSVCSETLSFSRPLILSSSSSHPLILSFSHPLILLSSHPLSFFLLSSLEPVEGGWPPTYDENLANQKAGSDLALKSLESEPSIGHMLQFMVAEGNYPMASV